MPLIEFDSSLTTPPMFSVSPFSLSHLQSLIQLFATIAEDPSAKTFHPHSFDEASAHRIIAYQGNDIYLGAFEKGMLVGYGMLRGWDAGYDIPSLGIYLAPMARGRGLASLFMAKLHQYAKDRLVSSIRLKVYPQNTVALRLYEKMGYCFKMEEEGQRVGIFTFNDV